MYGNEVSIDDNMDSSVVIDPVTTSHTKIQFLLRSSKMQRVSRSIEINKKSCGISGYMMIYENYKFQDSVSILLKILKPFTADKILFTLFQYTKNAQKLGSLFIDNSNTSCLMKVELFTGKIWFSDDMDENDGYLEIIKITQPSLENEVTLPVGTQSSVNFEKLLENEIDCDLIIFVNKETFKGHKLVLMAWSDVFQAMFSHNMNEKKSNELKIDDTDSDTFSIFLKYLYNGGKIKEVDISENLLSIADKYKILCLKKKCELHFIKNFTMTNACKLLHLAIRHSCEELKRTVLQYIVKNIKNLRDTEEFKLLCEDKELLYEFIHAL